MQGMSRHYLRVILVTAALAAVCAADSQPVINSASWSPADLVPVAIATTVADALHVISRLAPKLDATAVPHISNTFRGYLSIFRGPGAFVFADAPLWERDVFAQTEHVTLKSLFTAIVSDARLHAMDRFGFAAGSFLSALLIFVLLNKVAKRASLLKPLRNVSSTNFIVLTLIATVPLGLPLLEVLAAMAAIPLGSYFPAALIGALLRPYTMPLLIAALRLMSACRSCEWISNTAAVAFKCLTSPVSSTSAVSDAYQTVMWLSMGGAVGAAVILLIRSQLFEDERIDLDSDDDE